MELDKKIDEYSDELFNDLGLMSLPEEQKAEIFARLQDHLHQVILTTLKKVLDSNEIKKIDMALEQENYGELSVILSRHQVHLPELEEKIQKEFDQLKIIIAKEQEHDGTTP